jgi:hypothetical protein
MTSLFIGLGNLLLGVAYAGLGSLSAWETITLHRYRGWSRFGVGFSMMAASCDPHHLVHGWHVLQGESISAPMVAATLIGLPAGLIFLLLRFETVMGGQGDRLVATSPRQAALLVGVFTLIAGWLSGSAFTQPEANVPFQVLCTSATLVVRATAPGAGIDIASVTFIANMFVAVTYGMVGWYLADSQARRRLTSGTWSLSGVSLAGVFFTCALMHIVDATTRGSPLMLAFDLIGIPASVYFLWVVKRLHSDSVMDWNRRPLVGAAIAPARRSPWSGETQMH